MALSLVPARTRTTTTSAPEALGYGVRGCTLALGGRGARAEAVAKWQLRRRAGAGTAEAACWRHIEIGKVAADSTLIAG